MPFSFKFFFFCAATEWGSPWTEDDVAARAGIEKKNAQEIIMSFYNIVLADMMLFPVLQARLEPRGAFLNDASWEERKQKQEEEDRRRAAAADKKEERKRGDALRRGASSNRRHACFARS